MAGGKLVRKQDSRYRSSVSGAPAGSFRPRKGACAITSNHSVYLHNVYFEHSKAIVCIEGQPELKGEAERWTHIERSTPQGPPCNTRHGWAEPCGGMRCTSTDTP